ncbi:DUF771 domain-containing protein [Streptococcus suis]|uniref:DUF771 domain-containing protein n=2 Tax=Streptococcus suis TaxID=1307 RepID=G7SD39_STRSU|nr:DUF771 domain-containing protein [Streptococcus suis]AER18450.1 conserved hypothetical protein [Streptococcus suis D12]AIG42636.1 hypothetical protein ID09_00595 [Streptococcus suis 6407]ANC99092.1 hypothetical protein A6M16_00660 [Streptococcus suis]AOM73812.1 hypothetical protein BFP66_00550 [Streptococcus suis]MBL6516080.1 DUF771 domain-containing protein [Streptococcus suis]
MDTITVQLENIVIKLPETHLIVAKEDYRKLQEQASEGQYWTLSDVLSLLSVSRPWLLDNILYKPEIRSQIDIDKNTNGFVKYPQNKGGRYFFLASKTKEYFEKNFKDIFK